MDSRLVLCDLFQPDPRNTNTHRCILEPDHGSLHECACGHIWETPATA